MEGRTSLNALPALVLVSVATVGLLSSTGYADVGQVIYSTPGEVPQFQDGQPILTYGSYELALRHDYCMLVLTDSGRWIWTTQWPFIVHHCVVTFTDGGVLDVKDMDRSESTFSTPAGPGGQYVAVLQRDRNIVIYGPAMWSAGTNVA